MNQAHSLQVLVVSYLELNLIAKMRSSTFLNCFWLLALRGDVARAYWRTACSVSQTSRTDPILSPGTVSGHVHKFAGGNSEVPRFDTEAHLLMPPDVNQDSTQDSLLASTCSTCEIQEDKSAYWTPQLFYAHSNGTVEEVQNDGMTVYYVGTDILPLSEASTDQSPGRGGDSSNTVAFPQASVCCRETLYNAHTTRRP